MRHPVILSTVEEDFRAIGLLPELSEADDPKEPRDIPSPDPSTLSGLDDSEGDKEAETPTARQPKPKMCPPDDDAEESGYEPEEAGGSQQKSKGEYKKVPHGKEASLESKMYRKSDKQPMMGNKRNRGDKVMMAKGLMPVKKIGGMKEESTTLNKAHALLEEVSGLIRGVQTDEAVDEMLRSFKLVAENAALLSDRLTEISDQYEVESITSEMEELSRDAVEMIDIIENELSNVGDCEDEDEMIRNSSDVHEENDGKPKADHDPNEPYDIPSPAFKEQTEVVLNAMVAKLMDSLEVYDHALVEMGMGPMMDEDDGDEVHLHTKAKKIHVHHGHDAGHQEPDGDEDGPDTDDDGDGYTAASHDGGEEEGDDGEDYDDGDGDEEEGDEDGDEDEGDEDSDHEGNSLMARMKALKARRAAMHGGKNFHGGEEEDESY
jgi:hypothetical protein